MKPTPAYIISAIKQHNVIPLFYNDDVGASISIINALYNAGVRVVEYTNRGDKAIDNFQSLIKEKDERWPDLILCAGTIKTVNAARQFIDAGADCIISPGIIPAIGTTVQKENILWVPGCLTSTEIIMAEEYGAKLIKIFPGSLLGPSYIIALIEIFPNLMFMPTGGVDVSEENLNTWFKAGVTAVGLGSKLISKQLMQQEDYDAIQKLAKQTLLLVKKIIAQTANNINV